MDARLTGDLPSGFGGEWCSTFDLINSTLQRFNLSTNKAAQTELRPPGVSPSGFWENCRAGTPGAQWRPLGLGLLRFACRSNTARTSALLLGKAISTGSSPHISLSVGFAPADRGDLTISSRRVELWTTGLAANTRWCLYAHRLPYSSLPLA